MTRAIGAENGVSGETPDTAPETGALPGTIAGCGGNRLAESSLHHNQPASPTKFASNCNPTV